MMNLITKKQFIKILLITLLIISIFSFQLGAEESQIRVMAAASLTEVFTEFAEAYERAYGTRVELNFAGSQALYSQLKMGVRADIFASANLEYMTDLEELELVGSPKIFAENKLVIAVSKDKNSIREITDLTAEAVKLVIADESVPVGAYTVEMLARISSVLSSDYRKKVMVNVISKEVDVKNVINKIYLGEADAAVVYQTDITSRVKKEVKTIEISGKYNVRASYPAAVLKASNNKEEAQQFIDYIYSAAGEEILAKYGFINPGSD